MTRIFLAVILTAFTLISLGCAITSEKGTAAKEDARERALWKIMS